MWIGPRDGQGDWDPMVFVSRDLGQGLALIFLGRLGLGQSRVKNLPGFWAWDSSPLDKNPWDWKSRPMPIPGMNRENNLSYFQTLQKNAVY